MLRWTLVLKRSDRSRLQAIFHFETAMKVAMTGGLLLSSCCAVVSAVLTADMSEKAPHLADVGVRLARTSEATTDQKKVDRKMLKTQKKNLRKSQRIYKTLKIQIFDLKWSE